MLLFSYVFLTATVEMFMSHQFCLNPSHSPTYYNLVQHLTQLNWHSTPNPLAADFSENHFDFCLAATQCLEFKHLLASLVHQYCPEVMPTTYVLNEDTALSHLEALLEMHISGAWILKPA